MPYQVHCACGQAINIDATQAGSTIECQCGSLVDIPNLSDLRKQAGQQPLGWDLIAEINRSIEAGEYPPRGLCPLTGDQPNSIVQVHVQCEKSWQKSYHTLGERIGYILAFGWVGMLFTKGSPPPETMGRDTEITLPLRIRVEAKKDFLRLKSAKLKTILAGYPLYQRLFEKYPEAIVSHESEA